MVVAGEVGNRSILSFAEADMGLWPFVMPLDGASRLVLMLGILGAMVVDRDEIEEKN